MSITTTQRPKPAPAPDSPPARQSTADGFRADEIEQMLTEQERIELDHRRQEELARLAELARFD